MTRGDRPAASGAPVLVLDARMVGPKPVGIGTYVSLLIRGLADRAPLPYRLEVMIAPDGPNPGAAEWCGWQTRTLRTPFLGIGEQFELPRALRSIVSEAGPARVVYHSPSFSSLLHCPVPWMVTVHDLIHLRYGNAAQRLYYRRLVRPFFRGAAARTTVSRHSRDELTAWADVPPESIEVVNGAVDPGLAAQPDAAETRRILDAFGLEPKRFLFCLSSPKRHKNVGLLVEAYRAYAGRARTGGPGPLPLVLNLPDHGSVPGVRGMGTLSALQAQVLAANAAGFFFPSRAEGFGFPPLEAAVAASPVVVSDIPPLHEALEPFGEDELTWLDPDDRAAWTEAMERATRGALPAPSPESRAKAMDRFSPGRLAAAMDGIYRRVLGVTE